MPHNTRIRSTGLWITGSTITQDELERLDQAQYEAINGDAGGTWAPSSLITIGGLGMTVSGPFRGSDIIAATWNAGGTATLTGSGATMTFDNSALLAVTDDAEFRLNRAGDYLLRAFNESAAGQKLHLYGDFLARSGSQVIVKSGGTIATELGSAASIAGNVGFFAEVDFNGSTVVTRASGSTDTFESGATLDLDSGSIFTNGATETRTGPTTRSGSAATYKVRMATTATTDDTIDVSADVWIVPSLTGATTRTYTVDTTGAANGMIIEVKHSEPGGVGAGGFDLVSSTTVTLFSSGLGYHSFVRLVYSGSDWTLLDAKSYDGASLAGTGLWGN